MKLRIKDLRVVKWVGMAATVVAVALWIGSFMVWAHAVVQNALTLDVSSGQIVIGWYPALGDRHSSVQWLPPPKDQPVRWWFCRSHEAAFWWFGTPMWAPCVLLSAGTLWLWRRDARLTRRREGSCPVCHYDRRGLDIARVCPECGSTRPPTAQRSA